MLKREFLRNKGEWSKLYALVHVLVTGRLDAFMQTGAQNEYRVIGIEVGKEGELKTFEIDGDQVIVKNLEQGQSEVSISRPWLAVQCGHLIEEIMDEEKKGSYLSEVGDALVSSLSFDRMFTANTRHDVRIIVEDLQDRSVIKIEIFVKSLLGSKPTLLNSSRATNLRYRINDEISTELLCELEGLSPTALVNELVQRDIEIQFVSMDSRLRKNLESIDLQLPGFLAAALLTSYSGIDRGFENVVSQTLVLNLLGMRFKKSEEIYHQMCDRMLQEICLGMTATSNWRTSETQRRGLIEVQPDGIPRLIELWSNSQFEKYLYKASKFETPSRAKFQFGELVKLDNQVFFDLNLQIRFK